MSRREQFNVNQLTVDTINGIPYTGAKYAGLWTKRIIYVDGTNGNDGRVGLTPDSALKTIAAAIAKATTDDTIYIRPLAVGGRYTETLTVPVSTNAGLSIIGTSPSRGNSVYQGCSIRAAASATAATITANSSYLGLENLHFWSRATQTLAFGVLLRWNTPTGLALNIGSAITNCTFTHDIDDSPAAAGVAQAAIRMDSTEGQLVQGNIFSNTRVGISIGSTASASYAIDIIGNIFKGIASNIAADIYMTDVVNVNIDNNRMGHAVPSHAAGTLAKYVYCAGTVTGVMTNNTQGAADVAAATNNTLSSIICSGNTGLAGPWTS